MGYTLSLEADEDLENIYDYGLEKFGKKQAIQYLLELESVFSQLSENPEMGRSRKELHSGIRSFPKISHIIFYHVNRNNHIRIIRILHGSCDAFHFFG